MLAISIGTGRLGWIVCVVLLASGVVQRSAASPPAIPRIVSDVTDGRGVEKTLRLETGQTVEISARIVNPSGLPPNGRLRARWQLAGADDPSQVPRAPQGESGRAIDAFEIYTAPTPNWSKLIHALDNDVFVVYRAPVAGEYTFSVAPETGEVALFEGERWREIGAAPHVDSVPRAVPWPAGASVQVEVSVQPVDLEANADLLIHAELEPNDTPEQAQVISLPESALREDCDELALQIVGTSDDVEYFDNGRVGRSGDDWFRVEFAGSSKKLLTACLSIPDQQVAARIRCYKVDLEKTGPEGRVAADELLPIAEYSDGKNLNEIAHQQEELHRTAINRWIEPGQVYLLRVEANAPGYELELRVVQPAPYTDPRRAVRQGLYDHIGQVDAWLTNRPRGASVERRIRDSGNLLGTNCMSCHTQSAVWGPAIPFAMGYRPQNVQLWRHLINTCYQSMRPTNELPDAANNTSLRPLDLGDGPAGTRVAGHAVVSLERFLEPRKLQSFQARRAANYVVLTGDPGGINAAGPGANVGQGVVYNYSGEVVWSAWKKTGDPKYFRTLEDKVRKVLDVDPKYTDDLGHRVELLKRYVPADWVGAVQQVLKKEAELAVAPPAGEEAEEEDPAKAEDPIAAARELAGRIEKAIEQDLERLRAVQLEDGGWAFDPGGRTPDGKGWTRPTKGADPSPTALALIAFEAAGFGPDDPTVAKGLESLLKMQHPTGLWKVKSKTGFVSTSYALHALARFYPAEPPRYDAAKFAAPANESIMAAVRRVRDLSVAEDPKLVQHMIEAATHKSALVRYWAMIGLGATHTESGVSALILALGDPAKPVREAAHWALRQTLIDDRGWDQVFDVLKSGDDTVRETAIRALVMKVDGVLPRTAAGWDRLVAAFDHGLNADPHPGVRAWAAKAAWQWWVWNPDIREGVNRAWIRLFARSESEALVEHTIRYQSQALFIANGNVANGSKTHQYEALEALFKDLQALYTRAKKENPALARRLTERLVSVAATFYKLTGGDGGPGQMGYVTNGSAELFSEAILTNFDYVESLPQDAVYEQILQLTLEGAANIPRKPLQERLIRYSLEGPEKFRGLASSSISDPKLVKLIAVEERLEPMHRQLVRGAKEPPRRPQLSEPILKMFSRVRWLIPETRDQRDSILQYFVPDLAEYKSTAEIEKLTDTAAKESAKRDEDTGWYLASGLGKAISENTDLHFDAMAEALPAAWRNPAEAQFWVRSVPWILSFKTELPEVAPGALPPIDPYEELRTRAIRLYLTQLTPEAEARNRQEAVALANQTALRRNPEVLAALESLVQVEKDQKVIDTAQKALSTGRGKFLEDLKNAVKGEGESKYPVDGSGQPQMPPEFIEDFTYFRDYVVPEMSRVLRTDRRSCMACHGVPDRTPMDLHRPDDVGFLPVDKLLANYRALQGRIDYTKASRSSLLRKPLNVQTGKEDGHQGGRRYGPSDPGYQILTRWVENQVAHQDLMGRRQAPGGGGFQGDGGLCFRLLLMDSFYGPRLIAEGIPHSSQ